MATKFGLPLWAGLAAGGLITALPAAAFAQSAPTGGTGLEEVVVTAQKRSENLQKVPIAIAAMSEQALDRMQINSSQDLGQYLPGLNITRANVASIPFLRGVGNFTAAPGNEAAIATYVDDVYYASPAASTYSFNNISRIEVLKGPQGTLFGRNAAGGVIHVITKEPTSTPHADFEAGYANYNNVTASFYGAAGLATNLRGDLSVYYQKQTDGWGKNLFNGADVYLSNEFSVRTKLIWEPTTRTKIRFIADYDDVRNDQSVVFNILPGTVNVGGYRTFGGFYDTNSNFSTDGHQKQWGVSLRADQDLGWATFSSITAYRHTTGIGNQDGDASPLSVSTAHFNPKQFTTTQEFQLASPVESKLKWIVGLFYFDDTAGLGSLLQTGTTYAARPGSQQTLVDVQKTTSYAAFGQATYEVLPRTNLTLGARYTEDSRKIEGRFYEITGRIFNPASGSRTWAKDTYRVSLDHSFTDDILGYVSFNRGFKSGNFNINNPTQAPVSPMTLDAYEAGVKSDFFDNRLRLNVAAFSYKFNDLQVQQSILGATVQSNAAAAVYKGVDVEATWAATDNLTIIASGEVLDATYDSFKNAIFNFPCRTAPATVVACRTTVGGGGYYTQVSDATGLDIPYADQLTATLSGNYTLDLADNGELLFSGSVAYHDGFFFDVQNTLVQPTYTLVNASVRWTAPNKAFDVKLWGKNLTDEKYFAQQQVNASVANYSAQAPMTFGVTLGYHWN